MTSQGLTITITYCTQCNWLLRSAWMAQELLSTFGTELEAVTLVPGTGGIFKIEAGETLVWERKRDGGFPDIKTLKQASATSLIPAVIWAISTGEQRPLRRRAGDRNPMPKEARFRQTFPADALYRDASPPDIILHDISRAPRMTSARNTKEKSSDGHPDRRHRPRFHRPDH